MGHRDDLTGQTFGVIHVDGFSHVRYEGANKRHGRSYYDCTCEKCGVRLLLARSNILQYATRSRHQGHRQIRSEYHEGTI